MRACCLYGLAVAATLAPAAARADDLAESARKVLTARCTECHGNGPTARAGLHVLNVNDLRARQLIHPGKAADSELLQLVEAGTMPPGRREKVSPLEADALRRWIDAGAAPFVAPSPTDPLLAAIADDLRKLRASRADELRYQRYVSFRHLKGEPEAETCRAALSYGLNCLSWNKELARPVPVDGARTVFRIDLRALGWDEEPFGKGKENDHAPLNLFDLLLLEYPLAPPQDLKDASSQVLSDYFERAHMLRPAVYLRGDWLLATALRSPLYQDLLNLPRSLVELSKRLDVDDRPEQGLRAGLLASSTAPGQRLVVRRPALDGFLWQTYDRPAVKPGGSAGPAQRLLADALSGPPSPSQSLFLLKNGLPAFFTADADGKRLPSASGAEGKPIADGLDCLRCHARGPEPFDDAVRELALEPSLTFLSARDRERVKAYYAGQTAVNKAIRTDRRAVEDVLKGLAGTGAMADPLDVVLRRFEPGVMSAPSPGSLLPLDGLTLPRWQSAGGPVGLSFTAHNAADGAEATTFRPGDKVVLELKNNDSRPVFFELDYVLLGGNAFVKEPLRRLEPGESYIYPAQRSINKEQALVMGDEPATELYVLYASYERFPGGTRLHAGTASDRIVHEWYDKNGRPAAGVDLSRLVKRTLAIETRVGP